MVLSWFRRDSCWPLNYCLHHSKVFLLNQIWFLCLFRTTLSQLFHGTSKLPLRPFWNKMGSSVLSTEQFQQCPVSFRYQRWSEAFAAEIGHHCHIAYFLLKIIDDSTVYVITTTDPITIIDGGFFIWLIISASAHFFSCEFSLSPSTSLQSFPWCKFCILT